MTTQNWVTRLGAKQKDILAELEKLRLKFQRSEESPPAERGTKFQQFEDLFPELPKGRPQRPQIDPSILDDLMKQSLSGRQGKVDFGVSGKVTAPFTMPKAPVGELRPITIEETAARLLRSPERQAVLEPTKVPIPSTKVRVPTFSEWSATKGFNMAEYGSMLRGRGVAEADIPEMLLTTQKDLRDVYEFEFGLGRWGTATGELEKIAVAEPKKLLPVAKVFWQSLTKVPKQLGAAILQATQGQGGASVVDRDWADRLIVSAQTDIDKFAQEISEKYPDSKLMESFAQLPQNIAFSLTSMGAGVATGVPVALLPVPGARIAAWGVGSAASGAVAYSMTTYQIMQQYLEAKNEEMIASRGSGITAEEEKQLKADFEGKARAYGLWEAVPEAISNLAFARILTAPLTKIAGKNIAARIIEGLVGMYGEELLTETITQKGQSAIEVEAGLRESRISWTEAFKEIAPQTALLTTILGGIGSVSVASVNKVKQSLRTEIGTDHPLYQTLLEGIDARLTEILQEGAMAQGGLPSKLTADLWNATPVAQRVLNAQSAGLSGQVGEKAFKALTAAEKTALAKAIPIKPVQPASTPTTGAVVTPPVATEKVTWKITKSLDYALEDVKKYPLRFNRGDLAGILGSTGRVVSQDGITRYIYAPTIKGLQVFKNTKGLSATETRYWEVSKSGGRVKVIEYTKSFLEPAIPKAEVGMPEAGLQPEMFGAPSTEVRPAGRGKITQISMEDQLKLEQYQRNAEAEGLTEALRQDPVATYRFKMGNKSVGLDSLVSIREQSFPESLTVKQAQALNPRMSFAKYTEKGLKSYNKVPRDAALDGIAQELGYDYTGGIDDLADRVMAIRKEKARIKELERVARTQVTKLPLEPLPDLTPADVAENWASFGLNKPKYNLKQIDALNAVFADYLNQPNSLTAWELTRALRRETLAGKAENLRVRAQELIIKEGITSEDAMKQAIKETLAGELPAVTTDYLEGLTEDMRDALFYKVYNVLKDDPFEMTSTFTALTNALAGKPIPREPGIRGGSAYTRLQRVFGDQPKVLKAIDKMASEKKPLQDVVEGIFHETGRAPIPIDQATADFLRALPDYASQSTLGAVIPGEGAVKFVFDPSGKLGLALQGQQIELGETSKTIYKAYLSRSAVSGDTRLLFELDMVNNEIPEDVRGTVLSMFDKEGLDAAFDRLGIEMAQGTRPPKRPGFMEKNIWDEFEKPGMPNFTFGEKGIIIKVLKEIGMSPIDIGNFLRANMSSVDLSFFRTGRMLGSGHPVAFYKALVAGWKATWSEKEAIAHWKAITRDPDFELYEHIRLDTGYDPFRVPARERGIAAYRKAEEFGFPIEERWIPRMGAKLPHIKFSSRGFETALNDLVWSVWKQQLAMARRYGLKVASGEFKLKPGEAWDIVKEMTDHQRMLGDMIQRASLNMKVGTLHADFTPASPVLGGSLFAPRAKWARLIVGRHLFSANPRVRKEAWKDISIWIASTAGIIILGKMLGLWDTEEDPVSGEFASIRIGRVRIDPWEGHRQIVNLYARLITGQTKSAVTGKKRPSDVMDTLSNFVRSSLNVLPGLVVDLNVGKTYIGEKTDITNLKQTAQRVLPFSLSQIWQTFQENWRLGLATLPLSIAGESISVYQAPGGIPPRKVRTPTTAPTGRRTIPPRKKR